MNLPASESDPRRDDSPSSIDAIKRAIARSPIRRRQRRERGPQQQNRFLLKEDYRNRLPLWLSRFIGHRQPGTKAPFEPIPPFKPVKSIPLKYEIWFFGWIGSFVGILLVEAIMSNNTVFRDAYNVPIIIASFGASAVLIYGAVDSPLAQPRNLFGGHIISAIVGVCITRLFVLDPAYMGHLENRAFHPATFINGGLSMATAFLAMQITGTTHPPSGGTALIAAIEPNAVRLSWRYIPVIIATTCIMFGWALLINNLGRRRYPQYWWAPGKTFVHEDPEPPQGSEEMGMAASGQVGPGGKEDRTPDQIRRAGRSRPGPVAGSPVGA